MGKAISDQEAREVLEALEEQSLRMLHGESLRRPRTAVNPEREMKGIMRRQE